MELEKIDSVNLASAISAAKEIFPYEFHGEEFWPEEAYKEAIKNNWKNFAYYLAKINGKIVGITGHYPPEDEEPEIWLGWFGVRLKFRRKGYGQIILGETLDIVKNLGQKRLKLYSGLREEEFPAHKLYEKNGFKVTGYGEVDGAKVVYYCSPDLS